MWPYKNSSQYYKIYSQVSFGSAVIFLISLGTPIICSNDVKGAIQEMSIFISQMSMLIKMLILIFKHHQFVEIISRMEKSLILHSHDDEREKKIIWDGVKLSKKITIFAIYLYGGIGSLGLIIPIFKIRNEFTLPFVSGYPFQWDANWFNYVIAYGYQIINAIFTIHCFIGIESVVPCFLSIIGNYMLAIGYNFRKLGWSKLDEGTSESIDFSWKIKYHHELEKKMFYKLVGKYIEVSL